MTLVLLWAAPNGAAALRGGLHECPELLLLLFGSYAVLCPALHLRYVASLLASLCGLQAMLLASVPAYTASGRRDSVLNLLLRELLKAIMLNLLGVWLARRSERTNRETFVNAKLFQEELMLRKGPA